MIPSQRLLRTSLSSIPRCTDHLAPDRVLAVLRLLEARTVVADCAGADVGAGAVAGDLTEELELVLGRDLFALLVCAFSSRAELW